MVAYKKKVQCVIDFRIIAGKKKKQAAEIGGKTLIYVFKPLSQLHTRLQEGHFNFTFRWLILGQKEGLHTFVAVLDTSHNCLVNL